MDSPVHPRLNVSFDAVEDFLHPRRLPPRRRSKSRRQKILDVEGRRLSRNRSRSRIRVRTEGGREREGGGGRKEGEER